MPTRSRSEPRKPTVRRQPSDVPEEGCLADERMHHALAALKGQQEQARDILTRLDLEEQSQDRISVETGLKETQIRLVKSKTKAWDEKLGLKKPSRAHAPIKTAASRRGAGDASAVVDIERIVPVVAHALAVFGDEQKASHWLVTPLPILGNRSPAQILTRGDGVEAVDQILGRIEHNIPS